MTERERAMAERIASRLCEPHYRRRIIEMTIIVDDRKKPPDVTFNRIRKNVFIKVFPAKDKSSAVAWTIDALLKGYTVFHGLGGRSLAGGDYLEDIPIPEQP